MRLDNWWLHVRTVEDVCFKVLRILRVYKSSQKTANVLKFTEYCKCIKVKEEAGEGAVGV